MVNSDCVLTPLRSVSELGYSDSEDVFVRPNDDLKAFAGEVMTFRDLCDWATVIEGGQFEIDGSLLVAALVWVVVLPGLAEAHSPYVVMIESVDQVLEADLR